MRNSGAPLLTPNQITITRFFLIFPLFAGWFLTDDSFIRSWICAGFAMIFIADAWDGLVARKYKLSSVFGVYFDPVVDHISYFALCLMMIDAGYLSYWFLFVFITRDFLVVFIKQYAAAEKVVISASFLAKVKADLVSVPLAALYWIGATADQPQVQWTVLFGVGLYLVLFKYIFKASREHTITLRSVLVVLGIVFFFRPETMDLARYYEAVYTIMALIAAIGSGMLYLWMSRDLLFRENSTKPSCQS